MTIDEAKAEAVRRWGPGGAAWIRRGGGYDSNGVFRRSKGPVEYCVGVDGRDLFGAGNGGYRARGIAGSFVAAFVDAKEKGYP